MKKISNEEFIKRAKEVHGNKYDYSKVNYINRRTKVCIICPKHGEFLQGPYEHIRGQNCPECSKEHVNNLNKNKSISASIDFEKKARKIHGDKYDYSKVEYKNALTKVCIICPKHGEFWQRPNDHLNGLACPKCGVEHRAKKRSMTTEEFITKAREVHNNKYDYSKVNYVNNHTKVCIICPKHGEFWQTPGGHLGGKGCSMCSESFLEGQVRNWLEKRNIDYICQKKFEWLINEKPLRLDFYLPKYNIAIECQGLQHYKPVDFANKGKEWAFKIFQKNKERDNIKKELCENNGVKLIYFNYNDKINILKNKIEWAQQGLMD